MKKLKFFLPLALALSILAGCSNSAEKGETSASESTAPVSAATEETSDALTQEADTEQPENTEALEEVTIDYVKEVENMMAEDEPFGSTYTLPEIDYGELTKVTYYSTTAERDTRVNILLPAGYSENEKYPVLYALHGYWGNEDSLLSGDGSLKIQQIIGNLVAEGEAEKMIVVFPYIYTSKDKAVLTGMDLENSLNYDNFINDLVTDLMPFIEENYAVATGRENTAVTGFSMGGRESLFIGFTRSDLFGYVGSVCPAPGLTPGADLNAHPGQLQESELVIKEGEKAPYLVMISAALNDGVVGNSPETYHNILIENGVEHIWHVVTKGDHGGNSIRPHIYNFAKAIFKAN